MQEEINRLRQQLADQQKLIKSLEHDAMSDPLTGLVNRRVFEKELNKSVVLSRRHARRGALMMIDIDDFKDINDTMGHAAGDAVLMHIAKILRENTRLSDVVARFGGDEFCVILNDLCEGVDLAERAAYLTEAITRTPCDTGEQNVQVRVSIGVYEFSDADTLTNIIRRADAAMYEEKAVHHHSS